MYGSSTVVMAQKEETEKEGQKRKMRPFLEEGIFMVGGPLYGAFFRVFKLALLLSADDFLDNRHP